MTLVNSETGEIVVLLDRDEALHLTATIKGHVSQAWRFLAEAHHRRADLALGYSSWEEYVRAEFDMERAHAYRLLNQAAVIAEIESAISSVTDGEWMSPVGDIATAVTERAARDIKPNLKAVTDSIKEQVTAEATVDPGRVKEIVETVVEEKRAEAKQNAEDRRALADLNANGQKAGMDLDQDSLAERGNWSTYCREIADRTPSPPTFLARHREHLNDRHIAQAQRAHAWLGQFLDLIGESK